MYNVAHVYNRETPRLSGFDPHKQCGACRAGGLPFTLGVKAQAAEGEGRERGAVGRRGWHVAGEDSRLSAHRQ